MGKSLFFHVARWSVIFKTSNLIETELRYNMEMQEAIVLEIQSMLQEAPDEAVKILQNPKYRKALEDTSWDIVPLLAAHLTDKNQLEFPHLYNACIKLMLEVATIGNPDEVLFEFVEQAEKQSNHNRFMIMLKGMKIVLLRMPQRRGTSIDWCCNAIINHLKKFPSPQTMCNDDGVEKTDSEQVAEVESFYSSVIDFFEPFVKEIMGNSFSIPMKHVEVYKDTILRTFTQLFGHPLMYNSLNHPSNKPKEPCRIIAEKIINYVNSLNIDVLSFLDSVCETTSDYNNSLGVFYYLIFGEGVCIKQVPNVYSNFYLMTQFLWLGISLMSSNNSSVQWKGLVLAEIGFEKLGNKGLDFKETNKNQCKCFAELCTKIMIFSESRQNRIKAVPTFDKFLRLFDPCGRYFLILSVLDTIKEPGFIGYLITKAKDFIAEALKSKDSEELKYFTGKCLRDLVSKFCKLEEGLETDLIRSSDHIISSLNLLRFLLIRDKENITGFFEIVPELDAIFLTPLKKALVHSRTFYENQLVDNSNPTQINSPVNVVVGGMKLPNLLSEQKLQILHTAINTFDLIDSLLSRVTECIHYHESF